MSLIVALAISALGLSVRAIFENSHDNTGYQANDIVSVAVTQVGYGEGYDGYTKYGDWYGLPYSDWCAMFVSWCADQAGVSRDVFPSFALCSAGADWFISQGRFHYAGDYQPQAGDLIFYSSYGDIYHVGLVTGSDDDNVYSIEGNYCEAVYNVSYPLSYGDIMGYATPAYAQGGDAPVINLTQNSTWDDGEEDEEFYAQPEEDEDEDEDESETVESYVSEEEDDDESEAVVDTASDDEDEDDSEESAKEDDTPAVSILLGDANGDGIVDSADALLIQRYLASKVDTSTETFIFINADANANGEIDVLDALVVLEASVSDAA